MKKSIADNYKKALWQPTNIEGVHKSYALGVKISGLTKSAPDTVFADKTFYGYSRQEIEVARHNIPVVIAALGDLAKRELGLLEYEVAFRSGLVLPTKSQIEEDYKGWHHDNIHPRGIFYFWYSSMPILFEGKTRARTITNGGGALIKVNQLKAPRHNSPLNTGISPVRRVSVRIIDSKSFEMEGL